MRRLRSLLIVLLYLLASVAVSWPLVRSFGGSIPSSRVAFDPGLQVFILGWDWQALPRQPLEIFNAPIFHPEPRTLTYMDHMIGEAIVAAPVFLATKSHAAGYNFLFIASFVLSGWAGYRLVRLFRVPRDGAALCGFLFAFSPYRFANLDLLNQLQTQFLPIGLFFGIRYLQRQKLRDAAAAVATIVVQVYFGWYYAYYLVVALALLLATELVGRGWRSHHTGRLLGIAALGLLAVLPVSWPYFEQRLTMTEFQRSLGESALYSADILDYLTGNSSAVLAGIVPFPTGPQSYWPGAATVALGLVGALSLLRMVKRSALEPLGNRGWSTLRRISSGVRETVRQMGLQGYWLVLAVASFILSLGPILHVAGHKIWIPLPYAALYFITPGFSSMRAPARFAVLTLLAVVVLAGLGYRVLRQRLDGRSKGFRVAIVLVLFIVGGISSWPRPIHVLELPTQATMPPVYRWLAKQPDGMPILEFPVPARDSDENEIHSLRQFLILYHGKRRVDGSSGFVSPRYREFRSAVRSFPNDGALSAIASMGARLIVVHLGDFVGGTATLERRISAQPRLVARARFGDDAVYELLY